MCMATSRGASLVRSQCLLLIVPYCRARAVYFILALVEGTIDLTLVKHIYV